MQSARPKFKVGDFVRISLERKAFQKSYLVNYTDELFKIVRVNPSRPRTFVLEDLKGEPIAGRFYEEELSLADPDTMYRIEKILRTRRRNGRLESLVKWTGFPASSNSWVVL